MSGGAEEADGPGFELGIDENGLGSRLGPMIVTGVLARVTPEGRRRLRRPARGALGTRLGDSKALVAHGDVALAEAWARILVARTQRRPEVTSDASDASDASERALSLSADELVHALSLDPRAELRAPCPEGLEAQCWTLPQGPGGAALLPLARLVARDLERLEARGIEIASVRSVVLCAQRMNQARDLGRSRFSVDLHAMERLLVALGEAAGAEISATCGKVGGFSRYPGAFGPLAGRPVFTLEESRARSAYRIPGLGEVAFLRDADASNLLVSMASLVGKFLRELTMGAIVAHYRALHEPGREPGHEAGPRVSMRASGYHDPVTARFVEATRLVRARREVPDACFERR